MNTELVSRLQNLLAEADAVMQLLTDNIVTVDNYKQLAFDLDSTSGSVVLGLFNVREHIVDAIDQYEG